MTEVGNHEHALVLLHNLLISACNNSDNMARNVRALLPRRLANEIGKDFHIALRKTCRDELIDAVYSFLKPFDNVGCTLPEGALGFTILARTYREGVIEEVPIKEPNVDWADMWLEFMIDRFGE